MISVLVIRLCVLKDYTPVQLDAIESDIIQSTQASW